MNVYEKNRLIAMHAICFDTIEYKLPTEDIDTFVINLSSKIVGDLHTRRTHEAGWVRIVLGGQAFYTPIQQDSIEVCEKLIDASLMAKRVRIQTSVEVRQFEGGPCISMMHNDIVANAESFHAVGFMANTPFGQYEPAESRATPGRFQKLAYLNTAPAKQVFMNLLQLDDVVTDLYIDRKKLAGFHPDAGADATGFVFRTLAVSPGFIQDPVTLEISAHLKETDFVAERVVRYIRVELALAIALVARKGTLSIYDAETGGSIIDLSLVDDIKISQTLPGQELEPR